MTLPKKGSRTLTVNGVSYRWMVTGNDLVIDVIIEQDGVNGQKLRSSFDYHDGTPDGQKRKVTPQTIQKLIVSALDAGWVSGSQGKPDFGINGELAVPI
ncbi:MAG: hypothetical protein QM501_11225 [Gimesia sp.]